MILVLIVLLIIFALGAAPLWPYSRDWGNRPLGGVVGVFLLILLILFLTGNLR